MKKHNLCQPFWRQHFVNRSSKTLQSNLNFSSTPRFVNGGSWEMPEPKPEMRKGTHRLLVVRNLFQPVHRKWYQGLFWYSSTASASHSFPAIRKSFSAWKSSWILRPPKRSGSTPYKTAPSFLKTLTTALSPLPARSTFLPGLFLLLCDSPWRMNKILPDTQIMKFSY